jgi:glycosyltransferase involved in cell wall biosynthesis
MPGSVVVKVVFEPRCGNVDETKDKKLMRIAHFSMGRVSPDSANGVDKTVYFLSRTQASAGNDVAIFSLTGKVALEIPGVEVTTHGPRTLPFSLGDRLDDLLVARSPFNLRRDLVANLIDWKPDVLHLHFVHVPQNIVLAARASRAGIPYVVTINGGLSAVAQQRNRMLKRAFKALVEGRYLENAAFLHVISDQDLRGLRSFGVRNTAVLAPNGIDLGSIPQRTDDQALFTRFPELSSKRIFMFLGRLDPEQKGLDLLIEAFGLAREPGVALVVAGPDWRSNRIRLEKLADTHAVADRVVFSGPLFGQEKFDFLAGSDVFVHPSRWEAGVPFSVLEAAASGKPTLLSSGADPSRRFASLGAGLHVELDPTSMAQAIRQLANTSRENLIGMGAQARRIVTRDFAWEPIAATIVDSYRTLAGRS